MGAIDRIFRGRRGGQERPLAAQIAALFAAGEQGLWYDPSDLSTMYQDASGTLPVYRPGQGQVDPPVGLILDKRKGLVRGGELLANGGFATDLSGWSQSTAGFWQWSGGRAYHPLGSAYADLTQTVPVTTGWVLIEFDYTVVTASNTAQWSYANAAGTSRSFDSGGGMARLQNGSGRVSFIARDGIQKIVFSRYSTAEFYIDNVTIKALPGNHAYQSSTTSRPTLSARYNLLTGTDSLSTQSISVATATYVLSTSGAGSVTLSGAASGTYSAGSRAISCTAGTLTITVTGSVTLADLRGEKDGVGLPPYQRVVDPNTYDTAGFPLYLRFDGVDDCLQTLSMDLTGTSKILLAVAVRKFSDAAAGIVTEFSSDANSNNGAFFLIFPRSGALNEPAFLSRGSAISLVANGSNSYPSPLSHLLIATSDIAGDVANLRINGVQTAQNASDQGTGNYGNYVLYIGRRAGAANPFSGRVYGYILLGADATDAKIGRVGRYLNQKAKVF